MRRSVPTLISALALLFPSTAFAANYDEAGMGDLSGDGLAPTPITLDLGTNLISATSVSGDREYFTVTVPTGQRLRAIRVTAYAGADQTAFLAIQSGPQVTVPFQNPSPQIGLLLGYTHFGPAVEPVGANVLDNAATGAGAQGFPTLLGAGTYSFWAQQTGVNAATYTLAFDVSRSPAVPVPPLFSAALAVGLGLVGLSRLKRRAPGASAARRRARASAARE